MDFGDLLEERRDVIEARWVDAVLSAYPADAAALFRTQQDPFANPLGHGVRAGIRGIFQVILSGMDPEELRSHLDQIIRIRAVQELTPGEALSFVFTLRSIVREVIPEAEENGRWKKGLTELDGKVDQVALAAFELYAAMREELAQLRVKEVKRQVAWVLDKINQREGGPQEMPEDSSQKTSAYEHVQREDL
jgi:hypothetical protein